MKLRHNGNGQPLIIAETTDKARDLADDLGVLAHVRGLRGEAGRGCSASAVFIDDAVWPLTDDQMASILPVLSISGGPVYRIQRVFG